MKERVQAGCKPEERAVSIPAGEIVSLAGNLAVPVAAAGIVVFAHGSGSSRFSARNRYVAEVLRRSRIGTLLLDLLTADEEVSERNTGRLRFDIPLLAGRLGAAADWLGQQVYSRLPVGFFGASTGAAAALVAAAARPEEVKAVVSRGGRPDLAGASLRTVRCPTLLIVGGADTEVLALNRRALEQLQGTRRLEVIPGATHLFEEPGTLEAVARLAADWFGRHLRT